MKTENVMLIMPCGFGMPSSPDGMVINTEKNIVEVVGDALVDKENDGLRFAGSRDISME